MIKKKYKPTSWQIISMGYIVVIMLGALLLSLPISVKESVDVSFINALFTSTSATCVTGLVVYDTFTSWTLFGQIVILILIQIGGIGFMTIITLFFLIVRKQVGLYERKILIQSAGLLKQAGVMKIIKRIIIGTILFETVGALILFSQFYKELGFLNGIYYSVFHSISAFCNAGFDLMGYSQQFSSFTAYSENIIVNLTLIVLIFIGGIGFIVWNDIIENKFRVKKYNLHTKIVLLTSFVLIIFSTLLFFVFEKDNLFQNKSPGNALLASLFHSVTPRTAGFNTLDVASMTDSSFLLTIMLMFIGGSSGSTAGGIKITTFLVLLISIISITKRNLDINIGKKRVEYTLIHHAFVITIVYIFVIMISAMIMAAIEPFSLKNILFEVVSALGTVGLTTGITPSLQLFSKLIIIMLMYAGRVGVITLAFTFAEKHSSPPVRKPIEKILIG